MLHELEEKLRESLREFREKVEHLKSESDLNDLKGRLIGKKGGRVTEVLAAFGKLTPEERAKIGQLANEVKREIETGLKQKFSEIKSGLRHYTLKVETGEYKMTGGEVEFSLGTVEPKPAPWGARHPVTLVRQDIEEFFITQGYAVVEGPEIETDFYNFAALNFPDDHPARDMQDTIFVDLPAHPTEGPWVLRTHTSPVQIRTMVNEKRERPDPDFASGGVLKIICPGKVYRHDDDLTHSPMFHQIEGLCVGQAISLSHLKGTLLGFIRHVFGGQAQIRLRPSFFPFVEPGVEVDMSCTMCAGTGCRSCKQTGFMEILGAGMVHPNLFKAVAEKRCSLGLAPLYFDFAANRATVTGFAFGTGLDRIAMLRYGIPSIKLLFSGDLRFLTQFRNL